MAKKREKTNCMKHTACTRSVQLIASQDFLSFFKLELDKCLKLAQTSESSFYKTENKQVTDFICVLTQWDPGRF